MESLEKFLDQCQVSSQSCYDSWKELLSLLEAHPTRSKSRRFLERIVEVAVDKDNDPEFLKKHHFGIDTLVMGSSGQREDRLQLLNFPSIFTPEDWSFTFFEGLARYPVSEFLGRSLVELGCGNGWVSLAMTKRCSPSMVKGLDINPRAITCAKINAYLNFFDPLGHPLEAEDGELLIDKIEFLESDLLGALLASGKTFDRVMGCIPQVLNPDPQKTLAVVSELTSDELLYSLSNYCEKQGYIEDQFGLGLVARAIEESVEILKPSGKLILNLGGRPGQKVLERLYTRRGFHVRKVWATRVLQAADTDIDALVEIENHSSHRFEFYMGLNHDEPISAQTAHAFAKSGGQIGHALTVFEGRIRSQGNLKRLFATLKQPHFEGARSSLDLSFSDDLLVDEKLSFLAELSSQLFPKPLFPYDKIRGSTDVRRRFAEFFRSYWKIPTTAKSFLIAPNRQEIIANTLLMLDAKRVLIDRELSRNTGIKCQPLSKGSNEATEASFVLEIPRSSQQICELILHLRPQVVICVLESDDAKSLDSYKRLVESAGKVGCLLLLDISPDFELSSSPKHHAVLRQLSAEPLPENVLLLCGLVRNRVYADLEMAFVYSECEPVLEAYEKIAEITYSRTALPTQKYYDRILFDLLSFQMPRSRGEAGPRHPRPSPPSWDFPLLIDLTPGAKRSFEHASFVAESLHPEKSTLRLDYGENEFCVPSALANSILESFVRENLQAQECDVGPEVRELVRLRIGAVGLSLDSDRAEVVPGHGVAPLFSALLENIRSENGALLFPTGAYGFFEASAEGHGVRIEKIETTPKSRFRLTSDELGLLISKLRSKETSLSLFLYMNAPFINPTGVSYPPAELDGIWRVCKQHKVTVILDAVFAGLEHEERHPGFSTSSNSPQEDPRFVYLGGFSKEFAAGGLRFGYAISADKQLSQGIRSRLRSHPHSTTLYAAKRTLGLLLEGSPSLVSEAAHQRRTLSARATSLTQVLSRKGWRVIPPSGGLFLVAEPPKALREAADRSLAEAKESGVETPSALDGLQWHFFKNLDILINPPQWTGLPGHYRFVLSVDEPVFELALKKLENL